MARACAAQTKSTFLKLAGPQLVQMFIGDGAKLVRDAFALAKEKAPAIIFIDELDAIGTKRFDSEKAGDREVQRTMLELLNQLDGFSSTADIKVCTILSKISHFQNINFHKIHYFKISFYAKFTFTKLHFSQNSHFKIIIFGKTIIKKQCPKNSSN